MSLLPWFLISVPLVLISPLAPRDGADSKAPPGEKNSTMNPVHAETKKLSGYAPVNGLKMYYEIEGTGDPLVFIPPAFGFAGRQSFPALLQDHSIITVDLQGNGRTADIPE